MSGAASTVGALAAAASFGLSDVAFTYAHMATLRLVDFVLRGIVARVV